MARIKYAAGETPILNKHSGFTFIPNSYGQSMFQGQRNNRTRRPNQNQQQQNLQKAIRFWRDMSTTTKANWNNFAATFPQASRRNPALFLSGYQLFLKRSHYCFLNYGVNDDFMVNPKLSELPVPNFTVSFNTSDADVDCTENFLKYFGRLPEAGQYVLVKVYPMAEESGQFFEPIEQTVKVDNVYLDGLFITLNFVTPAPGLSFSIYLSRVYHQSTNYVGTKVRYMACFTPKTFLKLTDTPDSYEDQAGKFPRVNDEENALEFATPSEISSELSEAKCGTVIFDENSEWSHQENDEYLFFDNKEDPFNKNISLKVLDLPSNSAIDFQSGAYIPNDKFAAVVLYIKLTEEITAEQDINLLFIYEDEHTSNQITLTFVKDLLNVWQPVLIPLSLFTFDTPTFTGIQLFFTISTGALPFPLLYIDYVALMLTETEPDCTCFCLPSEGCEICLPVPTEGDAGKVPTVNEAADGYDLEEAGGGGLTCEDLPECPTIISINQQLESIINTLLADLDTSLPPVIFGLLYNYPVITSSYMLTSSDSWVIPSKTDYETLANAVSDPLTAGQQMKIYNLDFWLAPNTGANNATKFNGVGSGYRNGGDGKFYNQRALTRFSTTSEKDANSIYSYELSAYKTWFKEKYNAKNQANPIRLIYAGSGIPSNYIGNNGRIYRVIKIGYNYWLADNLVETQFRTGANIQWHGSNPSSFFTSLEWSSLAIPATCAYNNDLANVAPNFSFS